MGGDKLLELLNSIVTGIVIAVKGSVDSEGRFIVTDYVFCNGYDYRSSIPSNSSSNSDSNMELCETETPKYVLFVSGIEMGDDPNKPQTNEEYLLACQMLVDYITGRNNAAEQASQIVR